MSFAAIAVMAIFIEAVVNALKPIWSAEARQDRNLISFYVALGTGIALSVLGSVDIFDASGVPLATFSFLAPWAGFVFTGIILSRGANVVADLLQRLRALLVEDDFEGFGPQ